jgi:hypothetical protein
MIPLFPIEVEHDQRDSEDPAIITNSPLDQLPDHFV